MTCNLKRKLFAVNRLIGISFKQNCNDGGLVSFKMFLRSAATRVIAVPRFLLRKTTVILTEPGLS